MVYLRPGHVDKPAEIKFDFQKLYRGLYRRPYIAKSANIA
jgi:hypothetical protein